MGQTRQLRQLYRSSKVDSQDSLNSDIEVLHGTDENSLNNDMEVKCDRQESPDNASSVHERYNRALCFGKGIIWPIVQHPIY